MSLHSPTKHVWQQSWSQQISLLSFESQNSVADTNLSHSKIFPKLCSNFNSAQEREDAERAAVHFALLRSACTFDVCFPLSLHMPQPCPALSFPLRVKLSNVKYTAKGEVHSQYTKVHTDTHKLEWLETEDEPREHYDYDSVSLVQ